MDTAGDVLLDAEGFPITDNGTDHRNCRASYSSGEPEDTEVLRSHHIKRRSDQQRQHNPEMFHNIFMNQKDSRKHFGNDELVTIFYEGRLIQVTKSKLKSLYQRYFHSTVTHSKAVTTKRRRKKSGSRKVVKITGWEEYLYGRNVLEQKKEYCLLNCRTGIFRRIASMIPRQLVDAIVYLLCLKMFFVIYISYDMFWKLYCFCMQAEHVRIHDAAAEKGVDIEFTGSFFQAPYSSYLKEVWCAHCAHKRAETTAMKLLKRYRKENEFMKKPKG